MNNEEIVDYDDDDQDYTCDGIKEDSDDDLSDVTLDKLKLSKLKKNRGKNNSESEYLATKKSQEEGLKKVLKRTNLNVKDFVK